MNKHTFITKYWQLFLLLENRFLSLKTFIEFDTDNYKTFSHELLSLYLSIGSEIDVFLRAACNDLNANSNFYKLRRKFESNFETLSNFQVNVSLFSVKLCPFQNQDQDAQIIWWKHYNEVKHQRDQKYGEASLENVLASLAGLFLLEKIYYRCCFNANDETQGEAFSFGESHLFNIENWRYHISSHIIFDPKSGESILIGTNIDGGAL